MKTLLLMRHGKSDWPPDVPDEERPLSKRGLKDVPAMGNLLRKSDNIPEIIFSSPAKRARQTAELLSKNAGFDGEIQTLPAIYAGNAEKILEEVRKFNDKFKSAMIIGHNPNLEDLAGLIIAGRAGGAKIRFPTSALSAFEFEISSWKEIIPGSGTVVWLLNPGINLN